MLDFVKNILGIGAVKLSKFERRDLRRIDRESYVEECKLLADKSGKLKAKDRFKNVD